MGLFRRKCVEAPSEPIPFGETAAGDPLVAAPSGEIEAAINRIVDEVGRRYTTAPADPIPVLLFGGYPSVSGRDISTIERDTVVLAATVARLGYYTRMVETEFFKSARDVPPELVDLLQRRQGETGQEWGDTIMDASQVWARSESLAPPPEESGAMSWMMPGLGGEIRGKIARRSVGGLPPSEASTDDLIRTWKYGFFVRCCEEALPPGASLS